MKTGTAFFLTAGLCACLTPARGESAGRSVSVEIRTDDGRSLPLYPAHGRGYDARVYAEAVQGAHYRIVVRNHQNRRVGVVIAVDGRNIISGQKSWLKRNERMYVLGPHETQEYAGWRSATDRIHRFYFTEAGDSYASAFGDESAMGLISVAAYAESRPWIPPRPWFFENRERNRRDSGSHAPESAPSPGLSGRADAAPSPGLSGRADAAPRKEAQSPAEQEDRRAGTGYGTEDYSPSYTVEFEPERTPLEKVLIKYEWRDTLQRLGVLYRPPPPPQPPRNRLWDEGYAPPPPRRY